MGAMSYAFAYFCVLCKLILNIDYVISSNVLPLKIFDTDF